MSAPTAATPLEAGRETPLVLRRRWVRAAACLFALGATVGTLLDAIHTQSGVTAYTTPVLLQTAWWVPLLFGVAFANGLVRPLFDRGAAPPRAAVAEAMALFALAYGLSIVPLDWPLVAAILTAVFVAAWWRCDRSRIGLAIALASAILGPAFEVALVRGGAFLHTKPAYVGVSGWLPFLYLTAAIALQSLAKWLVDGE